MCTFTDLNLDIDHDLAVSDVSGRNNEEDFCDDMECEDNGIM